MTYTHVYLRGEVPGHPVADDGTVNWNEDRHLHGLFGFVDMPGTTLFIRRARRMWALDLDQVPPHQVELMMVTSHPLSAE